MVGRGVSTVSSIVEEVSQVLVNHLWNDCVSIHLPDSTEAFKEKILDMEELWQFPCCWAAIDGCHIPIKCPPGGLESCKEFHNFKNFYCIVLMAMVDSKYRFVWGSCGFPGNSHNAIILKSTNVWDALQNGLLPNIAKVVGEVSIPPLIVGDSAFPLQSWLMKPYTNATLSPKQRYFNYRLSRARMVTESAYGQLKGRWRVLFRKNESNKERVRTVTLACMVLHNICIERGDSILLQGSLTCQWIQAPRKRGIVKRLGSFCKWPIAEVLKTPLLKQWKGEMLCEKLWVEKETGKVWTGVKQGTLLYRATTSWLPLQIVAIDFLCLKTNCKFL